MLEAEVTSSKNSGFDAVDFRSVPLSSYGLRINGVIKCPKPDHS